MTSAVTATGRLLRKLPGVPRVHKVIAVKPDGAVRTVLKREHT
jgi:hypothetical protein